MKTNDEIQEAHDVLHAILEYNLDLRPEERMPEQLSKPMHAAHDAVAWVLGFPCGDQFTNNLQHVRKELEDAGYKLVKFTSHPE